MDQTTHEVRLTNWKTLINECQSRPKGQTTKQWLAEHDVSEKQYYYWLRKIRQKAYAEMRPALPEPAGETLQAPAFVEIPPDKVLEDDVPAVTIRTKRSTIMISTAVSEDVMVRLLKAVSRAL